MAEVIAPIQCVDVFSALTCAVLVNVNKAVTILNTDSGISLVSEKFVKIYGLRCNGRDPPGDCGHRGHFSAADCGRAM